MVSNPFSEGLTVKISADSSGLRNELHSAIAILSNFDTAVAGVGAGLMALAGGGLVASVKAAANFEEAMVGVAKVTDPKFAKEFEGAIRSMARAMPVAHKELARIAEIGAQLGVPREQLEHFTKTVAMMAATTDLSADEAANAFARIGTLMDIPYEKVDELGSAMNELSNNMGTSAAEISNVMVRAGASFHALGLAEGEALGLAAAMNEVSPSSRLAAGGLKRMSEALLEPSKVEKIAAALGMTTAEFKNIIDNNPQQALMMVAQMMAEGGPKADQLREDIGNVAGEFAILGSNLDGVEKGTKIANEQMENGTSLAKEFETATSTFNAKLAILKNNLVDVAIGIGSVLLPFLSKLVGALIVGVQAFAAINDMTGGWLGAIVLLGTFLAGLIMFVAGTVSALGGLAAVLGPVMAGVKALATVIGILMNPMGMLIAAKGALIAVGSALATVLTLIGWPILLLIGLIALLAAMWHSNFGGIRDQTERVMKVLRDEFGPIIDKLGSIFNAVMPDISAAVGAMFKAIEPIFGALFRLIADVLIWAIIGLADVTIMVVNGLIAAWNLLEPAFNAVVSGLLVLADIFAVIFIDLFKMVSAIIRGDWEEAWMWIYNIFADIMGRIIGFLSQWFPQVDTMMDGKLGKWRDQWRQFGHDLWATISETFAGLLGIIEPALGFIRMAIDNFTTIVTGIISQATALWHGEWGAAWTGIFDIFSAILTRIAVFLEQWFPGITTMVLIYLTKWRMQWEAWGQQLRDLVSRVFGAIHTAASSVMTALSSIFGPYLAEIHALWTYYWGLIRTEAALTWNAIKLTVTNAMTSVRTAVATVMAALYGLVAPYLAQLRALWTMYGMQIRNEAILTWNAVRDKILGTVQQINALITPIIAAISTKWAAFGAKTRAVATATWNAVQARTAPFFAWFRTATISVLTALEAQWARFRATVLALVRVLAAGVTMLVRGMMNIARSVFTSGLNAIAGFFRVWAVNVRLIVRAMAATVTGIIKILMSSVATLIIAGLRAIRGDWQGAWNAITSHVRRTTSIIRGILATWRNVIVAIFSTMKTQVQRRVRGMIDTIVGYVRNGISRFRTAGRDMINALVAGIKSVAGKPGRAVSGILGRVRRKLAGSDAEEGPLSDLTAASRAIPETLAAEMLGGKRLVSQAASEMAAAALFAPQPQAPVRQLALDDSALTDRLDTLIREVRAGDGENVVYLDGKKVGTLSNKAVEKHKTSFEVTR